MGAKYSTLKVLGVMGTVFSFYRAMAESIAVDDVIIVLTASLLVISVAIELDKSNKAKKPKREETVDQDLRKQAESFEKAIAEKLEKAATA